MNKYWTKKLEKKTIITKDKVILKNEGTKECACWRSDQTKFIYRIFIVIII